MQIIDDKGKVLGIINIIDLTVLLFIISTITGFWWLMHTGELFKDQNPAKKLFMEKDVEILFKTRSDLIVAAIQDEIIKQQYSEERFKVIKIISIEKSVKKIGSIEITKNDLFDIT